MIHQRFQNDTDKCFVVEQNVHGVNGRSVLEAFIDIESGDFNRWRRSEDDVGTMGGPTGKLDVVLQDAVDECQRAADVPTIDRPNAFPQRDITKGQVKTTGLLMHLEQPMFETAIKPHRLGWSSAMCLPRTPSQRFA